MAASASVEVQSGHGPSGLSSGSFPARVQRAAPGERAAEGPSSGPPAVHPHSGACRDGAVVRGDAPGRAHRVLPGRSHKPSAGTRHRRPANAERKRRVCSRGPGPGAGAPAADAPSRGAEGGTHAPNRAASRGAAALALVAIALLTAAANVHASIDATQFCNRIAQMRAAILEQLPSAQATCTHADPDAVPAVEASYETDITAGDLASIRTLNFYSDIPLVPDVRRFKAGDFDGLIRVVNLILVEQSWIARTGLAGAGVPAEVRRRLETLVMENSDLNRIRDPNYFKGLTNLRTLSVTTNNMVYELPGNPHRPQGTAMGREINPEAWRPLANLRELKIGSNRILTLPRGFFRHLRRLEVLDMFDMWYEYHPYGFGSQALPAGVFEGLTRLRKLDLGYNALGAAAIDEGLFDGLSALEELDLRENPLLKVLPRSVLDLPAGVRVRTDPGVAWPAGEENQSPTGVPVIEGTAQVGQTLSVSLAQIDDPDGLENATFSYRWWGNGWDWRHDLANASGETNATAATYRLIEADEGEGIRVRVTFTDDAGTQETLVSAPTAPVAAAGTVVAPPTTTMSIAAFASPVTEGAEAVFTVSRTGDASGALDVAVTVSESGAMLDGTAPATVTFAAGASTATLALATADDETVEEPSTVTATVAAGEGYTVATDGVFAEVTVEDDDAAPVITTPRTLQVPENTTRVATLTATDADTEQTELTWSLPAGTSAGPDASAFELTETDTLSFRSAKDFEAPDDANEDTTYELAVQVTDGANPIGATLEITLVDADEIAPTLTAASVNATTLTLSFSEALDVDSKPTADAFAVSIDGAPRTVETVELSESRVMLALASQVAAGQSVTVGYTPPTGPDAAPLTDAAGNRVAAFARETVTNETPGADAPPEVSIRAQADQVTEGSDVVFTLTRADPISEALTVSLQISESGAMLASTRPEHATFAPAARDTDVTVATVDDDADESDSTLTIEVLAGTGYAPAPDQARATATVLDNDTPPPAPIAEPLWSADMKVKAYTSTWIGAATANRFSNQAGSAGLQARALWYQTTWRTMRLEFTSAIPDTEGLALHIGDQALALPAGSAGTLRAQWTGVDVDWSHNQVVPVRLSAQTTDARADATLKTLTLAGAALDPDFDPATTDYRGSVDSDTRTVTVSAAANDADATFAITPETDADPHTAGHQVEVPFGETLIAVNVTAQDGEAQRTYRVVLNRAPPAITVSFGAASYTATEGGDAAAVAIVLSADPGRTVTIPLTATPAGGADATDYAAPASTTFAAGGTLTQTVSVAASADNEAEIGETVVLGFGTLPPNVGAGATATATVSLQDRPPDNSAPRGLPEISGTAKVDEVLNASVGSITDDDGLTNATFAYQWLTSDETGDTEIAGANASTHQVARTEVGKRLRVRVTFTDDRGAEEVLTSAATEPVAARAADAPATLTAATPEGTEGTLEISWTTPPSDGGSQITSYTVQWKSNGEDYDATAASTRQASINDPSVLSHRIEGLTVDTRYTVRVQAVNDVGDGAPAEVEATAQDRRAPSLIAATVSATTLTLAFSEHLDATSQPPADAFAATAAGVARTVTDVAISASTVALTLASAAASGELVTVSYTAPAGANTGALKDRAGNRAAGFTDAPVRNETAALPTVSISPGISPVTEGTPAAFALTRTGAVAASLTVTIDVTESGAVLADPPPATVTLEARSTTATLELASADDEVAESASTITVKLLPADAWTVGTGTAHITVEDDDAAPLVTTPGPIEALENATTITTLEATDADTPATDLIWSVAGGPDAQRLTLTASGALSFNTAKDFEAPDDADANGVYEVTARITDGANPVDTLLEVQLVDVDEVKPTLISAWVSARTLVLRFSEALDQDSAPKPDAFAVSATETARTVRSVTLSGSTVELTLAPEITARDTVTVSYTAPTGESATPLTDRSGNAVASFTAQAVSNQTPAPPPTPEIAVRAQGTLIEEGADAVFTLTRSGTGTSALTVSVIIEETGTMIAATAPETVTFAPERVSVQIAVATSDDETHESDSTVTLRVVPATGYRPSPNHATGSVTVLDNDAPAPAAGTETLWSADMRVKAYYSTWLGAATADRFSNQAGSAGLQARALWYHTTWRTIRLEFHERNFRQRRSHAAHRQPIAAIAPGQPRQEACGMDRGGRELDRRPGAFRAHERVIRRHHPGRAGTDGARGLGSDAEPRLRPHEARLPRGGRLEHPQRHGVGHGERRQRHARIRTRSRCRSRGREPPGASAIRRDTDRGDGDRTRRRDATTLPRDCSARTARAHGVVPIARVHGDRRRRRRRGGDHPQRRSATPGPDTAQSSCRGRRRRERLRHPDRCDLRKRRITDSDRNRQRRNGRRRRERRTRRAQLRAATGRDHARDDSEHNGHAHGRQHAPKRATDHLGAADSGPGADGVDRRHRRRRRARQCGVHLPMARERRRTRYRDRRRKADNARSDAEPSRQETQAAGDVHRRPRHAGGTHERGHRAGAAAARRGVDHCQHHTDHGRHRRGVYACAQRKPIGATHGGRRHIGHRGVHRRHTTHTDRLRRRRGDDDTAACDHQRRDRRSGRADQRVDHARRRLRDLRRSRDEPDRRVRRRRSDSDVDRAVVRRHDGGRVRKWNHRSRQRRAADEHRRDREPPSTVAAVRPNESNASAHVLERDPGRG